MKFSFAIIALIFTSSVFCQRHSLQGVWQGISTTRTQKPEQGMALWMEFDINTKTGEFTGFARYEKPYEEFFAYKKMKGTVTSDSTLEFEEVSIRKKEESSFLIWCKNFGDLTYNSKTGYLEGSWRSSDCPRQMGKIILYRSRYEMSRTDTNSLYHSWVDNFAGDLKRGWPAYYVRDAEMRNFEMRPVLFDHDKDSLKPEFRPFLEQMAKIVESHSDLRIKIIGHTDSNGTDEYNIDLSRRRAYQVKNYLIKLGVREDRIVIEFRGERDPATSNATNEGKSLNRRVDFEFI
ncbi:MAG: OmpA family protein [Crocinitomicaceae bacterium]|nr:OmpA family protein [Crocinitomicaceae bacterium]